MKKSSRWTGAMMAVAGALVLLAPSTVNAQDVENPWVFRLRGIAAIPDESSAITTIGGKVDVGDSYMPELDISYFLTPNVALELILAVTKHGVDAVGTSAGDLDLGHVWLLPPTLTLQYHFVPEGPVSPYIGAGVNYTVFFSEDPGAATSIDYDDSVAFALQGGFDFPLNDRWGLNVDLKKVFLGSDVTVGALGTFVVADTDLDPWLLGVGFTFRP